jgi:hypothetical protein
MDSQGFDHYLNELQLRRHARRWWTKAVVTCATLGGVYGATLGVTIGAMPGAADPCRGKNNLICFFSVREGFCQ